MEDRRDTCTFQKNLYTGIHYYQQEERTILEQIKMLYFVTDSFCNFFFFFQCQHKLFLIDVFSSLSLIKSICDSYEIFAIADILYTCVVIQKSDYTASWLNLTEVQPVQNKRPYFWHGNNKRQAYLLLIMQRGFSVHFQKRAKVKYIRVF